MLNENELQFLVGLLYSVAGPDGVSVEVGSRVLDVASETKRDVDVTIRYTLNGCSIGLAGLEVKDEGRTLNSTHVEQLATKLADMPSLTSRGVVSASGFSRPARRKAQKHGLELFHFLPWDPSRHTFHGCTFPQAFPFQWFEPRWVDGPTAQVYSSPQLDQRVFAEALDAPVATPGARHATLRKVIDQSAQVVSRTWLQQEPGVPPRHVPIDVPATRVALEPQPMTIAVAGQVVTLTGVTVQGRLDWISRTLGTNYYMLQKEGENAPQFGCLITDVPAIGALIALVPSARGLGMVTIGPEQRAKRPFKYKL